MSSWLTSLFIHSNHCKQEPHKPGEARVLLDEFFPFQRLSFSQTSTLEFYLTLKMSVSVLTSGEDGKAPNQQKLYHQKSCGTSWKQLQLKAESVALSPNCLLSCPDAQLFGCHRPRGSWNTKATFCVDRHSREGNPHTTKKNMGCVCVRAEGNPTYSERIAFQA